MKPLVGKRRNRDPLSGLKKPAKNLGRYSNQCMECMMGARRKILAAIIPERRLSDCTE
jgi:hypothetical protein